MIHIDEDSKAKRILLTLIAAVIIGLVIVNLPMPEQPRVFPGFHLKDHYGNSFDYTDFEDKIVVINMWTSWCPFCIGELSKYAKLQSEMPEVVQVFALNRKGGKSTSKAFSEAIGISGDMVFLVDKKDVLYNKIRARGMPITIFINSPDNYVITTGVMDFDEIKQIIIDMSTN